MALRYGRNPKPHTEDGASEAEVAAWEDENNEAEGVIISAISKGQMQLLTSCTSAYEMWERLKDTYQHESKTNQLRLLEQYHSMTMKKGVSLECISRI